MSQSLKLSVLVAYPYMRPSISEPWVQHADIINLLIDSGAWSVWKIGKTITLDEYCKFIEGLPVPVWGYLTLDVIGHAQKTRDNYEAFRERGFNPIPIFTRGAELSELEYYFTTSEVVALGGVAGTKQRPYGYVKWLWPHVGGRKVHILGFGGMEWVKIFKPYSCDSSSWEAGGRFGEVKVYMGHGQVRRFKRPEFDNRPDPTTMERIRNLGFEPYALCNERNWRGDNSISRWVTAASWVALQIDAMRHVGSHLFLALAADRMDMLVDCFIYQTTGKWDKPEWRKTG